MRVGHANNRSLPASPTGSRSSVAPNPCVDAGRRVHRRRAVPSAAHRVRGAVLGSCSARGCPRARCRRALRHFFARGPPALTHALLFCPCGGPACAESAGARPSCPPCAFSGPGRAPPSCPAPGRLRAQPDLQVPEGGGEDGVGVGKWRAGVGATRGPLTAFRPRRRPRLSWPSRSPARPQSQQP